MDYVNSVNNEEVLGLYWGHEKDVIRINEVFNITEEANKEAINIIQTKRNILSVIASVYNPMVYLQPIVIN